MLRFVQVDDTLKTQMNNFLVSTANQQEIQGLDSKIHETVGQRLLLCMQNLFLPLLKLSSYRSREFVSRLSNNAFCRDQEVAALKNSKKNI